MLHCGVVFLQATGVKQNLQGKQNWPSLLQNIETNKTKSSTDFDYVVGGGSGGGRISLPCIQHTTQQHELSTNTASFTSFDF